MKPKVELIAAQTLVSAAGNVAVAEAKLIRQLIDDPQLMQEAVAPYLRAIALKLLDRAKHPAKAKVAGQGQGHEHLSLRAMAENPGYNPMQAEKSGPRSSASHRHVQTMHLLAAAYRGKPVREKV